MNVRRQDCVGALVALLSTGLLSASLLSTGCVHEKGESQLVWLQSGLESEFPDRGTAGEVDLSGKAPKSPPPGSPTAPAAELPVALEPAAVAPVAAEESVARPVIRVTGSGRARPASHGADDRIEVTLPDERTLASVPAAAAAKTATSDSKPEFDHALSLLNAHDYTHALEALLAFRSRWPDDPNTEAAIYWTAECYLAKGELVEAQVELEATLARFPQGAKVPDALLKLGITSERLGNKESAKVYFDRLSHEFPRSDAARRVPRST